MNFKSFLTNRLTSLNEGLEDVKNQHSSEWHSTIDNLHREVLPMGDKSDRLLHHSIKMLKDHLEYNQPLSHWDSYDVNRDTLKNAYQIVSRYNLKNNLGNVSDIEGLKSLVAPYRDKFNTEIAAKSSPIVHEDNQVIVKRHDSWQSSVEGAKLHSSNPEFHKLKTPGKAQWCVSADSDRGLNHYNEYTDWGTHKMYTLEDKNTKKRYAVIANPNERMNKLEFRDEYDEKMPPDFFEKHYPNLLSESNQSHFSKFLRHVKVNYDMYKKINNEEHISSSDFANFIKHDMSDNFNESLHSKIITNKNLEKSKNVVNYYSNVLRSGEGDAWTNNDIIGHIPLSKESINNFLEINYPKDSSRFDVGTAIRHPLADSKYSQEIIHHALHGNYTPNLASAVSHPSTTKGQLNSLLTGHYNNIYNDVVTAIIDHPKTSSGEIKNFIARHKDNSGHLFSDIGHALQSNKLTAEDIDELYKKHKNSYSYISTALIENPNTSRATHKDLRKEYASNHDSKWDYGYDSPYLMSLDKSNPTVDEFKNEIDNSFDLKNSDDIGKLRTLRQVGNNNVRKAIEDKLPHLIGQ